MKSESVIDALKAMDKATSREVAARLAIDHVDTLVMLQDEMARGTVECKNGRWSVVSAEESESGNTATVTASDASGYGDKAQGKISEQQMIDVIRKHGQQTAEELATLFGITVRKVASTLAMATNKGCLNRVNQGGKFRYCLPDECQPATQETTINSAELQVMEEDPAAREEQVIQSIPVFLNNPPDRFVFRLLTRGNQERRRARENLARLDEVCDALRVLHKHPQLIKTLSGDEQK
ncbi:DUF1627 domain-containing protein [Salmonella enterica subsp. enterica serovar Eastbourne]|nr:DUF1627 domain-containing protein [Salmonella enterica subsp. enterica serovar Eastbourne]EHC5907248.1 DUF1627 domain-containing protein [Salmonella enterica subsp. enterica serovar Eastbourne]